MGYAGRIEMDKQIIPLNLYHITGDKDLIFNYKKDQRPIVTKVSTHIMIFD